MRNKNIAGALMNPSGRRSWTITKTAVKEYLTNMYLLDTDGTDSAFQNAAGFTDDFFSCRTPVPAEFFSSDDYLLEVKASVDLIARPAPLSLLDPFIRSEITNTGWLRFGD
ncbi:MAG TPA: hypothetical protein DCO79_01525 [Spirochaeta sp.]|nr:hypothetical protein [Spirochaeta sp.]